MALNNDVVYTPKEKTLMNTLGKGMWHCHESKRSSYINCEANPNVQVLEMGNITDGKNMWQFQSQYKTGNSNYDKTSQWKLSKNIAFIEPSIKNMRSNSFLRLGRNSTRLSFHNKQSRDKHQPFRLCADLRNHTLYLSSKKFC